MAIAPPARRQWIRTRRCMGTSEAGGATRASNRVDASQSLAPGRSLATCQHSQLRAPTVACNSAQPRSGMHPRCIRLGEPALGAAQCLYTQCRCQALHILGGTELRALATPWDMLVAH